MPSFQDDDEDDFDPHSRARRGKDPDVDPDDWAEGDGPDPADLPPDDEDTIRCDECGKRYLESAAKCPHCGHYPTDDSTPKYPLWFLLTIAFCVLATLVYLFH